MIKTKSINKGFTLLEMLLVLAIGSVIFVMLINYSAQKTDQIRIDKATLQIQQILNASLAFYSDNSRWPMMSVGSTSSVGNISGNHELVVNGYLPAPSSDPTVTFKNPWGRAIYVGWVNSSTTPSYRSQYYVATIAGISGATYPGGVSPSARIVAGRLPLGFVTDFPNWDIINASTPTPPVPKTSSCASGDSCSYAVGSVSIPGQNLNNARSVNFASIYNSGACVPAPTCPFGMIPQILVVPASVSGINDNPGTTGSNTVYPLNSFTAHAYGDTDGTPKTPPIRSCANATLASCKTTADADLPASTAYWRVCLRVNTEKGEVTPTDNAWGQKIGSVMAITRCTPGTKSGTTYVPPSTEPAGTAFGYWQQ